MGRHISTNFDSTATLYFLRQNADCLSIYEMNDPFRQIQAEHVDQILEHTHKPILLSMFDESMNVSGVMLIGTSEWDSRHFGFAVGKIYLVCFRKGLEARTRALLIRKAFQKARSIGLDLVFARIMLNDCATIQALEMNGAYLTDVLLTLQLDSGKFHGLDMNDDVQVSLASPDMSNLLGEMAGEMFSTHFHADPYLPKSKSDDVYRMWILKDLKDANSVVLVAKKAGEIIGFISFRTGNRQDAYIGLIGRAANSSVQGVGRLLLSRALESLADKVVYVRTQASNIPALRLYTGCGFRPTLCQATLHHKFKSRR